MIPAFLGLGAWVAKGAVLLAIPRLVKALTSSSSPPPSVPCPSQTPLATVSVPLPQVSEAETRLARVFSVDGQGCIIRTYDAQGDVVSHFNGAGFSTKYQFDSMHRITRMTHRAQAGANFLATTPKAGWKVGVKPTTPSLVTRTGLSELTIRGLKRSDTPMTPWVGSPAWTTRWGPPATTTAQARTFSE